MDDTVTSMSTTTSRRSADQPEEATLLSDDDVSTEVAVAESVDAENDSTEWPYEWIEFEGDKLAVRKPTQQALAGFSLASSKYVKPHVRNDVTGAFVFNHMSEDAYYTVWSRLVDPDEPEYTVETIGALMRAIVELTTGPTPD